MMSTSPSSTATAAGCIIYAIVWLLLLKDKWAILPLGRTVSCLVGASFMVACQVLSPEAAFKAINLETIALLTGCMLVSSHMDKQGLYVLLSKTLSSVDTSNTLFLWKVAAVSHISSALLTNDTTCILFTEIVARACIQRKVHPGPYLIAVATSCNIGAAMSPIGAPQCMIIALLGGVSFLQFLAFIGLTSIMSLLLNTAYIAWMYREWLNGERQFQWDEEQLAKVDGAAMTPPALTGAGVAAAAAGQKAAAEEVPGISSSSSSSSGVNNTSSRVQQHLRLLDDEQQLSAGGAGAFEHWQALTPTMLAAGSKGPRHPGTEALPMAVPPSGAVAGAVAVTGPSGATATAPALAPSISSSPSTSTSPASSPFLPVSPLRRKLILFLLAILPAVLLFADKWIGLGWVTLLAGSILCILDGEEPEPILRKVDGSLLLFFSCLFIVVAGFNGTGVPEKAWDAVKDSISMSSSSGLFIYSLIILIGSNTVSNVPLVLLLSPKLAEMGSEALTAWVQLAWISTIAGNLTLLGSVANLIVAERCKSYYPLTFGEYAKIGFPSTVLLTAVGVPLVSLCIRIMAPLLE